MTDLPGLSRKINKWFGGGHEMVCSAIYKSNDPFLIWLLDYIFLKIDGKPNHCLRCYYTDHPKRRDIVSLYREKGGM